MGEQRLKKQFAFVEEIDKEKKIGRQTYLSDGNRKENDAEHAWHMAIMAYILKEYAKEEIDMLKTIVMILIHDIVEIDAGDTYAYDEEAKKTQNDREQAAAKRLYGLLPEEQGKELVKLWREFDKGVTPEARFARALDNIQPMMLNSLSGGKSWKENSVALSQILKRNQNTYLGSQMLWEYAKENYIKPNIKAKNIYDDSKSDLPSSGFTKTSD